MIFEGLRSFSCAVVAIFLASSIVSCKKKDDEDKDPVLTLKGSTDSGSGSLATENIDPQSVMVKILKVVVHESAYCDDENGGQTLLDLKEADAEYVDFTDEPTLGSGSIKEGTYNCIAFLMKDVIKPTPAESSDNNICVKGEEIELDVFADRGEESEDQTSELLDGTEVDAGDADQTISMYLSTKSTYTGSDGGNPFRPTSKDNLNYGFKLDGALTVSGDANVKFIVDFTNQIKEDGDRCDCMPPVWGFEKAE